MNQDDWYGSFLVVDQNGRVVTRLWVPPYEVTVEGDGPLTLRVVRLPKDLLGPLARPEPPARQSLDPDVVPTGHPNLATAR